jgi:trehalose synthase
VWDFLQPFVVRYDAAVFTLGSFVPPDFPVARTEIIPPAIDPESPKNLALSARLTARVLEWIGVDTRRPLIAQISRFDEWKDPLGVVAAYRLVREQVPDVQLALVGSMALDDPEGWRVYRTIQQEVAADPDIHVFTNLTGVGNVEVNAFQRLADVVVQKSIREGFGLVVSEALWKGTPVVAGRAGGIPLQLEDGRSGYLVDSVQECAQRVEELLADPDRRRAFGAHGQAHVRERFLLPRLLADELQLYASVLGAESSAGEAEMAGGSGQQRDPVCGMRVDEAHSRRLSFGGQDHYFCSASCEQQFAASPERFLRAVFRGPKTLVPRSWFPHAGRASRRA